jgi:hypothetical protein
VTSAPVWTRRFDRLCAGRKYATAQLARLPRRAVVVVASAFLPLTVEVVVTRNANLAGRGGKRRKAGDDQKSADGERSANP